MKTAIVWFRRDLRLSDNPALDAALEHAERIIPLYIYTAEDGEERDLGAAARWWLHHSLKALDNSLQQRGSALVIRQGRAKAVLEEVIRQSGADAILWNRLYEPAVIKRDQQLKQQLRKQGLTTMSFSATLLREPWQVLKDNGEAYKVFTPYWNALQRLGLPQHTTPPPRQMPPLPKRLPSLNPEALSLLPTLPWADGFHDHWQPGEAGAKEKLAWFVDTALSDYDALREIPGEPGTSRLSPHLHFGEISPQRIVEAVMAQANAASREGVLANAESYLRQLAWRDFAYYLLYHFPETLSEPFNARFNHFAWETNDPAALKAWQQGRTGIPIVDAGMRELWQTGWMHNRVRMIVASLLTKNLLQHWHSGARWFMDTLVDADAAANTLGWQWVAGCGADAAPYFRVFNPVLQGQKFDAKGRYVRRWVPELNALPDKYLHRPWEAPAKLLEACGIELGNDYPYPIVDLKRSRAEALHRYHELKSRPDA